MTWGEQGGGLGCATPTCIEALILVSVRRLSSTFFCSETSADRGGGRGGMVYVRHQKGREGGREGKGKRWEVLTVHHDKDSDLRGLPLVLHV